MGLVATATAAVHVGVSGAAVSASAVLAEEREKNECDNNDPKGGVVKQMAKAVHSILLKKE